MRKPTFFIIGAPKCGTSALSEYLRTHPNVFFCEPKEPHYFNSDFANRHTTGLTEYLGYFSAASDQHQAIGEGSVFYLNSHVAVNNILSFQPNALFIVMLRNPIEMSYSWHSQALYSFGEVELDFQSAWRLQEARREGRKVPRFCPEPKTLLYGELCLLGKQLERLYDQVPADRIKTIFYDDFARDTNVEYAKVLAFLELKPDTRGEFPRVNANKAFRSILFERATRNASAYWRDLKSVTGIQVKLGLRSHIRKFNTVSTERRPLSPNFVVELKEFFRDDIKKLEGLTDRDLSHWVKP